MMHPKIPLAQNLIEIFKQKGVQHIVISPGSRNAPLTIGFTANPFFTCYSIVDERCAAFFALGMAQQLQQPVAVVCTSGSALLNYYPAVAEAFYSQIPLLIVSADRPQSKIDIGDGQTIRQENVFANHSLYNANLNEEASEENDLKIQEAVFYAVSKKGPVHINVPFEEPLYETTEFPHGAPVLVDLIQKEEAFKLDKWIQEKWHSTSKKMILIGELAPNSLSETVIQSLVSDPSLVVLIEKSANLHHVQFIDKIDTLITPLNEQELTVLKPEILLTFGGMVVSKRIKSYLRKFQPQAHWHVDELRAYDTFGALKEHFVTHPNTFLAQLYAHLPEKQSDYATTVLAIWHKKIQKHQAYLTKMPYSDYKVFDFVSKHLPIHFQLQVSNSSAIRYVQLLDFSSLTSIYCNRGTSGIDGSTSTAIGAAVQTTNPVCLLTGDISFFYDSNALWNNYIPRNFKIIVINNSGGGIFRILPGHEETVTFNTYFETSHELSAEHVAKMHGLSYFKASDFSSLRSVWNAFIAESTPSILEVFTPEKENDKVLLGYFTALN
ncbi:MAG: Menaquinone biosynthesis protein MenD : 2-succinyl-6-hydroxy-2,4-cyclohexadiene-carboxylate [Bacteroidota bacterium]